MSLSWRTGDDIVVSRTDPQHPVSYVNLDGVNSDGPSRNLLAPVSTVAANPSTVYVADQRGVLQLSGSAAEDDPAWAEVRPLMIPGTAAGAVGLRLRYRRLRPSLPRSRSRSRRAPRCLA